jgi:hypothetical protein
MDEAIINLALLGSSMWEGLQPSSQGICNVIMADSNFASQGMAVEALLEE